MKAVFLAIFFFTSVNCQCSPKESVNITDGEAFQNGSVFHDGVEYIRSSWYEVEEEGVVSRMGCPCIGRVCLWKCCPEGQALNDFRECQDSDSLGVENPFNPPVYKGIDRVNVTAHERFFYMTNRLCDERYMVDTAAPNEKLYIQENATLYEISAGRHQWHVPTIYCVEMMVDNFTESPRMIAAVCYPEPTGDSPVLYIAYAVGILLSVPFLLATFLVYAFIPDLRNLHGMCLMSYCAGLIVAYIFLAYLKLQSGEIGVAMTGCYIVAFIVYYSFQSSFFWLNVMCFDIWRTFRGYRGGSSHKRRENRRFALYGAYAWGVPLLLAACTIGMQFADLPPGVIKPGFGVRKCWFENWISEMVYFFTPVLILVICNVVLFSITSYRIRSIRQETAILKGSESARSDKLKKDKQRFRTMFGMAAPAPDMRKSPWTSSTHTEDTRVSASADDPSIRLKDMR